MAAPFAILIGWAYGKLLNKEVAHDLDLHYTDPTSLLAG